MRVALIDVYSHKACTLKDVAGGYGTAFEIGDSFPARLLGAAKSHLISLPSPTLGYLASRLLQAKLQPLAVSLRRTDRQWDALPNVDAAVVLSSIVDFPAELQVVRELRRCGVPVLVVGAYASASPEPFVHAGATVVRGEAENLSANALYKLFREPAAPGITDAGFIGDLDTLPFPSWQLFPLEDYRYAMLSPSGYVAPLQGARGCAFGCSYCPFRVTAPFRERSPESIEREALFNRDEFGARALAFRDPLFNLDPARVQRLAAALRRVGLPFSAEMRADRLEPSLIDSLADAGLRSLEIGVESVDLGMLRKSKRKPPSHAQIEAVVEHASSRGVRVIANFMIGLPDDTRESIERTLAWAKRLNTFAVQFTVATPYPGTSLAPWADPDRVRPGTLTGWNPVLRHPNLRAEELAELRERAYVSYHLRPGYFWRFFRDTARSLFA